MAKSETDRYNDPPEVWRNNYDFSFLKKKDDEWDADPRHLTFKLPDL